MRELKSWAYDSKPKRRFKVTILGDLAGLFLRPARKPEGAPIRKAESGGRLGWHQLGFGSATANWRLPMVDIETVGSDALVGLERPFIFAVNDGGSLDGQLLNAALPRGLRPSNGRPSKALSQGRNVVVYSSEPDGGRLVGEFSTVAAQLATQHSAPIIPVGIVGSFRLSDTLKLRLDRKPKVSVRFGSAVYPRGRTIEQLTFDVQSRVEQLVGEGELTWWDVERRRGGGEQETPREMARWRRLWGQAAPRSRGVERTRVWR